MHLTRKMINDKVTRRWLIGASLVGIKALPAVLRGAEPGRILRSEDGLLDVAIEAGYDWVRLNGDYAHLYTYNKQVPGPMLEARPGDTVRLHFTNSLPEATNLHFHGLHVPPDGNADNVFLEVPPGERLRYEFTLPANHAAGMFWYHPHLHGAAASQLFRGLAGLLVVRGELDDMPEISAAAEHFLVLKDWTLDRNGEVPEPSMMERMTGREGSLITVGDDMNPVIAIQAAGLLRLRILNASPSRFYRLKLEEHPLHVIATDGGPIPALRTVEEILLTPGERMDVLVQGDRNPGVYRLLNLPYNRGGIGMAGGPVVSTQPEVLATIQYEGRSELALDLPQTLVPVEPLPPPETPARRFVLSESGVPGRGMRFLINGREFDHHRVDTQVRLGTVEDWEIINQSQMDHPFHLHTNSFQILDDEGRPERAWKDVMLVRSAQRRRLRVHFEDFAGKAVYHCHILDHEDLGMMGVIEMLG
jgi:FtsP/CotA-like multicopper oxidase with cupredoxin domain